MFRNEFLEALPMAWTNRPTTTPLHRSGSSAEDRLRSSFVFAMGCGASSSSTAQVAPLADFRAEILPGEPSFFGWKTAEQLFDRFEVIMYYIIIYTHLYEISNIYIFLFCSVELWGDFCAKELQTKCHRASHQAAPKLLQTKWRYHGSHGVVAKTVEFGGTKLAWLGWRGQCWVDST